MTGARAIFRHEWRSAWATPLAGTFILLYVVAAMLFTFFVGDFFAQGRADLQSFFQFQPWLLVLFAPALAMRAWSEEFQQGTAETLLTLPVSTFEIVLAKFLAQLCVAAIAILSTATLWITASYLGDPDHGVIVTSYFATLLIAAVLLALVNIASALCASSVSAFGLSLVMGTVLLALGAPLLQGVFSDFLPAPLAQALQNFGISGASRMMFQGLVRLSDVLNLLCATAAGLLITRTLVDRSRHIRAKHQQIPLILLALLLVIAASSWLLPALRLDLTAGRAFTLTTASQNIARGLREPVRLTLMLSSSGATNYPQLQSQITRVEDLLESFRKAGESKITLAKITVEPNSDSEISAQKSGVQAIETPQGDSLYFGLIATNSTNAIARLPFLGDTEVAQLEYAISRTILKVADPKVPQLGIVSSLPLATGRGGALAAARGQSSPMRLFTALQDNFELKLLLPDRLNLEGVSALLLIQPPPMSAEAQGAIADFAKAGHAVLVVADPWPERWQDQPGALASAGALMPLLASWGVTLAPDQLVVDPQNAQVVKSTTLSGTAQLQRYPLWLSIGGVTLLSSGAWQVGDGKVTALLRSSSRTAQLSIAEAMAGPTPEALAALPADQAQQLLAVRKGRLAFIADADMLDDDLWGSSSANSDFLLGTLDMLLLRPDLSGLRRRPNSVRPFTRLQALQAGAQALWGRKSAALVANMEKTRARLAQLEQSGNGSKARFAEIAAFRDRLAQTKRDLRAADRAVAQSLRQTERRLTAANLLAMPLLIALLTALLLLRRRRRMKASA
jgi:ABC-2 type transport system permease protein